MGPALSATTQLIPQLRTPVRLALVSFSAFLLSHGPKMMESICLDDSPDTDAHWSHVEHGYNVPHTPSTISEHLEGETDPRPEQYRQDSDDDNDEEYGGSTHAPPKRKKGGYDSRIEQILYENPDLPILIVDASKSSESGGKYIVYTIRTGVSRSGSSMACAHHSRISRSAGDTLNLPPSEMLCLDYILR